MKNMIAWILIALTAAPAWGAVPPTRFNGDVYSPTFHGALSGNATTATTATNFSGSLSGDVTGTQSATAIAAGVVSNSKLSSVSTQTIKGRTTSGTGSPEDLTATQATAILNAFTGDSGSGGVKGLVPAPGSGDAAANKVLGAGGSWVAQSGGTGSGSGIQLLSNPGFETGTAATGWTITTATGANELSTIYEGIHSEKLTYSASTGDIAQSVTPATQTASINMEASCKVNTSLSTIQVCSLSGGTEIQCQSVPATGGWQYVASNFVGPANGTSVGVRVKTSSSATGTVYVDDCYVGPARDLSQVSQAQVYGELSYAAASGCNWLVVQSAFSADFSANASCASPTVKGNASAPATKIPGITFPQMPPGEYIIMARGAFYRGVGSSASFRFYDGTTGSEEQGFYSNLTSNGYMVPVILGHFTYSTAQSNVTIRVQSKSNSSNSGIYTDTAVNGVPLTFTVLYYPSQSQTAYKADATPASWSGTSTLSATTASTSVADPGSVTGSVTTGTSRNLTCSASGFGISCTLPRAGNYQVCYAGSIQNSVATLTTSELTDGSNNIIVGIQNFNSYVAGAQGAVGGCGNYNAPAAGAATFKVRGYVFTGTGTFNISSMSVVELDAPMPSPYLTGSVTSNTSGAERIERATVTISSSSVCSVVSQSGSWISSITGGGTTCAITFATGEFSSAPSCSCTTDSQSGTNSWCRFNGGAARPSTTGMTIVDIDTGNVAHTGSKLDIVCMGPR